MRRLHAARPAVLATAAFAALAVLTACGSETGTPGAAGGNQPSGATPTATTGPSGSGSSAPGGPATSVPSESNLPSAPGKSAPPVAGEPTGPTLQLSGIAEKGVEPGCVLLRAGAKSYLLLGAKDVIVTGVPIKVTGKVITGVMSYCQQGTPLRVDSVTKG
jgi:hypothetical protein